MKPLKTIEASQAHQQQRSASWEPSLGQTSREIMPCKAKAVIRDMPTAVQGPNRRLDTFCHY